MTTNLVMVGDFGVVLIYDHFNISMIFYNSFSTLHIAFVKAFLQMVNVIYGSLVVNVNYEFVPKCYKCFTSHQLL